MKKNRIIGVVIALAACMFTGCKAPEDNSVKTEELGTFTRFDWIEMLDENMGYDFQETSVPSIFTDISENDPHYEAIKTAEQHEILVDGGVFEGDSAAERNFVAETAIRAIGKEKISFVEEIDDELTSERCNEIAKKYNLIEDDSGTVSKEEAEKILSNMKELSNTTFWPDEYEDVQFEDNVIDSKEEDSYPSINKEDSSVTVSEELYEKAETGNVILLEDNYSGIVYAKRVVSKEENNELEIEDVMDMSEVANSIKISKKVPVTIDDIFTYYGFPQDNSVAMVNANELLTDCSTRVQNKTSNTSSKGFQIEVESDDDSLNLTLINNANSSKLEFRDISDWDCDFASFKSSLDVKDITLGVQYEGDISDWMKMCNLSIESTINQNMTIQPLGKEGNDEIAKSIPLAELEIPLGWLPLNLKISLNLDIAVTGNIELNAIMKSCVEAGYSKERGLYASANIKDKDYGVDVNAQANAGLVGMPALYFSGIKNLMDVDLYAGVEADANMKLYKSGSCLAIDIYAPLVRFDVCADTDNPSLLRELCEKNSDDSEPLFSKEIISKENAAHTSLYYQKKTGEDEGFVSSCTVGVNEEEIQSVVWTVNPILDIDNVYYVYSKGENEEFIGDICPRKGASNETTAVDLDSQNCVTESFSGGIVTVEKDGKWGFYDYNGEARMEPVVSSISPVPSDDLGVIATDCPFVVTFGGCYQYPGECGGHVEKLVSSDYRTVTNYTIDGIGEDWLPAVVYNGKLYYLDEYLGECYQYVPMYYPSGTTPRMVVKEIASIEANPEVIGFCVIDENENIVSRFPANTNGGKFSSASDFNNGYYIAGTEGQQCLVNAETGKAVNEKIYEEVRPFNNGYAPVRRNGLWTFVDGNGNEVCEPLFEEATPLYEGKTYVKINGKYGILNLQETIAQGIKISEETCSQ